MLHYVLGIIKFLSTKNASGWLFPNSKWTINSPLYVRDEAAVQVSESRWKCAKESENGPMCIKSHCYSCLGFSWCRPPGKDSIITRGYCTSLLDLFKGVSRPNVHIWSRRMCSFTLMIKCLAHTSRVITVKHHDLRFEVLPYAPYSPDLITIYLRLKNSSSASLIFFW